MTDILVREHASGRFVAGCAYVRDGRVVLRSPCVWHSTATAALEAAQRRWGRQATHTTNGAPDARERKPARLSRQSKRAIRLMRERGGLTSLEAMHEGIGRLSARVHEIREAFGHDSIESVTVWQGRKRYTRYVWRGPDSVQGVLL